SIESAVGVGTTFSVTFKIGEIGDVAPVGSDHGPKGSVADVILVEDQGAAAEVLSQYLSQVGATVTHLSDGRNVVEVTKMKQPAAVVLDIVLPDHSGWDILKALKANPSTSHIPIIVVTILDEPEKSKALGAAVHLTKPVTKSQFQEAIRSVAPLAKQVIVAKDAATVLLVEDNPANLFVKDYLENQGFVVHVAENGPRGIEVARTVVPDIVLMDIQMPGMTGFEAMEIIRKDARLKNVKIVATTGLAMTGDRQRCLDAGADDYLAKPYRLEELEWVIANLLKHDLIS
ncbi:MAG: response regulator, partial [Gemmatimonadota bacterium]|nr:response regulator [Gemmatimonadota bacterium]